MASDLISVFLEDFINRAQKALAAESRAVARVVPVAPGMSPAWDNPERGLLFGRVARVAPMMSRDGVGKNCGVVSWTVTAAIAVVRCAATLNDQGDSPSAAQVSRDGLTMTADLTTVQQVLQCSPYTKEILGWEPFAEQGGAHGGEWTFTFTVPVQACSTSDSEETP